MLFQSAPPDTSAYMIAGYVVFTVIMAIYLISLVLRRRNLEQDLSTLQSLSAQSSPAAPAVRSPKGPAAKSRAPRPKARGRSASSKRPARKK